MPPAALVLVRNLPDKAPQTVKMTHLKTPFSFAKVSVEIRCQLWQTP